MSIREFAFNPELLIRARQSRGITQTDLANMMGIGQGTVSKLEAGLRSPTDDELLKLSDALDYPRHFFSQNTRAEGPGINELFHRKRQRMSAKRLEQIYATTDVQRMNIETLMRSKAEKDSEARAQFPWVPIEEMSDSPAKAALTLRALWYLPSGPVHNLTGLIEDAGGIVIRSDFRSRDMDGFSRRLCNRVPVFYMNKALPPDRWRWTLCHELGHIVMHSEPNDNMEKQADHFAAEFLMPASEIKQELWNLSFQKLSALKRIWKVSVQALVMRAHTLQVLTDFQRSDMLIQWSKAGYRTREPELLDSPMEVPASVHALLEYHRHVLHFSEDELMEMMAIGPRDYHVLDKPDEPYLTVI